MVVLRSVFNCFKGLGKWCYPNEANFTARCTLFWRCVFLFSQASDSFCCLIRSKCSLFFTLSASQALKYNAINWQCVFSVTFALPDCCWLLLTIFKSQTISTVTCTYIWLCHSLHMSGDLLATFSAGLTRWKLAHTKERKAMLALRWQPAFLFWCWLLLAVSAAGQSA